MTTVLAVEDNGANLKLLEAVLRHGGYDFLGAMNAADALAIVRNRRPDIILMDIQLPDMHGMEATALLKESAETAEIPVIAGTAHAMAGDAKRFVAAGCADYVAKPIRYARLLEVVAKHVGAARSV